MKWYSKAAGVFGSLFLISIFVFTILKIYSIPDQIMQWVVMATGGLMMIFIIIGGWSFWIKKFKGQKTENPKINKFIIIGFVLFLIGFPVMTLIKEIYTILVGAIGLALLIYGIYKTIQQH